MVDWKNIHPDFTPELQEEWENRGFNYKNCKSWIDDGCQPQEAELARYLYECQRNKLSYDVKIGRIEYPKWKDLGFDLKTIISWKKQGFTLEQINKECLEFGLTPSDYFYCCWLKNIKKLTPKQILGNEQQLREECDNASIITQQLLEENYPNKKLEWPNYEIYINQQLEGILDCNGYDGLWKISISSSVDSSKFEIKNASYKDGWDKTKETKIIHCIPAQEWLDINYPQDGTCLKKEQEWNSEKGVYEEKNHPDYGKTRTQITNLDINEQNLEGSLDLSDFPNLEVLICWNNHLTSLNVSKCDKLKEIECSNNQITNLDLSNLNQLKELDYSNNHLTQIPYLPNPKKLTQLYIKNNNFPPQDLSIFSQFRNLKVLGITDNLFTGSLEPLQNLNKLTWLDISHTNLNSGVEYLPESLEEIRYDTQDKPNCKLTEIKNQLDQHYWKDIHEDFIDENIVIRKNFWLDQGFTKEQTKQFFEEWNKDIELIRPWDREFLTWFLNFKKLDLTWALENEEEFKDLRDKYSYFGTCKECKQPNASGNYGSGWCQPCNAKHFQVEFLSWTSGSLEIDKFIQKCQLEATSSWNLLEWISYEQFNNIEHLADGGFGKVYKAEWEEGSIEKWDNKKGKWERRNYDKTVALKTLTNSQNLNQDFLSELTLYKMFKSEVSNMVPCYGVSKDEEGNYILVMKYMKEGNLREYLKKNYQKLSFERKFEFLQQISQGLKDIHRKHLIHRDFHSGNIIVDRDKCRITDLGLCKPANETDNSKIFGVLPYVAPEVLMGKPYTPTSDIYSFGIIAYEILTCLPPFANQAHDANLALKICQGTRAQFPQQVKYPQLLVDLINRCWDNEPTNRPAAREISKIISDWIYENGNLKTNTILYQQIQETEIYNQSLPPEIKFPKYKIHPSNTYTSKAIDTQQIIQLLQNPHYNLKTSELNKQLIKVKELINEIIANEKQKSSWETKTEQKYNDFKKALKLVFEKSDELEKIIVTNQLNISEEMKELLEKIKELKDKSQTEDSKCQELEEKISQKEKELEELKGTIIANNPEAKDNLEEFLEAQKANNSKWLKACQKRLNNQLAIKEINLLCQKQTEITQLTIQLEETTKRGDKQLTQIIKSINVDNVNVQHGYAIIGSQIGNDANFSYNDIEESVDRELVTGIKRQLSFSAESRNETKSIKLDQVYQSEPMEIDNNDWTNINSDFTSSLIQSWINYGFTPQQTREWINTNSLTLTQQTQVIQEPNYYAWLRDVKQVDAEWVINQGNEQELRQEFVQWNQAKLQAQIEVPPKNS